MPRSAIPEPAVAVGEDPRRYARLMSAVYDATMAGDRAPARPRKVIEDSWRRLMARGIDPDALPDVPTERAQALVELARAQRGLVPPPEDGDDVPDPIGGPQEAHHTAATLIREAVQRIVAVMLPAR